MGAPLASDRHFCKLLLIFFATDLGRTIAE
jgi:hypothetical protein